MIGKLKALFFRLLGKDPDAVIVTFASGDRALAQRVAEEIRTLVTERRHFLVADEQGGTWQIYRRLRRRFRHLRIGLAPVLFTAQPSALRRAAFLLAPRKILAYNPRLERHHLRLSTWIASLLFLRGVPLDRIFLRPRWLCPWKRDRSVFPAEYRVIEGRPASPERARVGVLSPYFPYPLSHGGAIRIFYLLREISREFDVDLFAFTDNETEADFARVAEFCARLILVPKSRYREPRWSTIEPPEVREFDSPAMRRALARLRPPLLQVEYTHLAPYRGDILVEHDVTFDLFGQVWRRLGTLQAWWDWFRWRRFERAALRRYPRVVVMSEKDRELLGGGPAIHVIENGVDLERFVAGPECPGQRLLFIGSFRHFPNIAAYRFFSGEVWPGLRKRFPEMTVTVVCGADHLTYWRTFTRELQPPADERIRMLGFVADVQPLYVESNIVLVPTTVSAGTNVKVLEAMAMERAIVSTISGCAGLGLEHGVSAWIADDPGGFAAGVATLAGDPGARRRMALAARALAESRFDWRALGAKQRDLLKTAIRAHPR